jgi:hypothetical protein
LQMQKGIEDCVAFSTRLSKQKKIDVMCLRVFLRQAQKPGTRLQRQSLEPNFAIRISKFGVHRESGLTCGNTVQYFTKRVAVGSLVFR